MVPLRETGMTDAHKSITHEAILRADAIEQRDARHDVQASRR